MYVKLIKKLGFDGVDINMGCPDRSIEKQGAGAAHMKDPKHAQEVIRAAPDLIIGSWCGKKFRPEQVAARPGWDTIPAVRDGELRHSPAGAIRAIQDRARADQRRRGEAEVLVKVANSE